MTHNPWAVFAVNSTSTLAAVAAGHYWLLLLLSRLFPARMRAARRAFTAWRASW